MIPFCRAVWTHLQALVKGQLCTTLGRRLNRFHLMRLTPSHKSYVSFMVSMNSHSLT